MGQGTELGDAGFARDAATAAPELLQEVDAFASLLPWLRLPDRRSLPPRGCSSLVWGRSSWRGGSFATRRP